MNKSTKLSNIDHSALKTNQAVIILLNLAGFILNLPALAITVTVVMLLGTALRRPGFGWIYAHFLRPLGLVQPDILRDNREPHLFAQGFGAIVMLAGSLFLLFGFSTIGWGFVWVMILLASLNLFGGFCMGCFVYYWFNRWQVPGFVRVVPDEPTTGFKPGKKL